MIYNEYIVAEEDSYIYPFADSSVSNVVYGCTDVNTTDDGECTYSYVYGCMDSGSTNYDPLATVDNGSCVFIYHHTFKLRVLADAGIFESGDCLEAILTNLDTIQWVY